MPSGVCANCHNKGCEIKDPVVAKWDLSATTWLECAFSSCADGLKAARDARDSGQYEDIFLADGSQIQAAMFGTAEKETADYYPHRGCTKAGIILGETLEGYKPTGQTLYTRSA
ncbi:MAG: hypothetical protein Q8L37_07310 [Candidatus Gottesmanbacteria bacterium]|nr:hypothetical protein [Candidatus Gottesmanbacteria bacterium]